MPNIANSTRAPDRQMNGSGFLLPKPRRKPFRMSRERRARLEAAVDGLLHLLDVLDGDSDDEENGDLEQNTGPSSADECELDPAEPWLGWTNGINQASRGWHGEPPMSGELAYAVEDGEQEHDGREPDADNEPDYEDADSAPDNNEPAAGLQIVGGLTKAGEMLGYILPADR